MLYCLSILEYSKESSWPSLQFYSLLAVSMLPPVAMVQVALTNFVILSFKIELSVHSDGGAISQ